MHPKASTPLVASTANTATTATSAAAVNGTSRGSGGNNKPALNPTLVQTGSQNNGSKEGGAETGQTPSAT